MKNEPTTADRLDRSLDIVIQRELADFRRESLERHEAESRQSTAGKSESGSAKPSKPEK